MHQECVFAGLPRVQNAREPDSFKPAGHQSAAQQASCIVTVHCACASVSCWLIMQQIGAGVLLV